MRAELAWRSGDPAGAAAALAEAEALVHPGDVFAAGAVARVRALLGPDG